MPLYSYRYINHTGKRRRGVIDAFSLAEAKDKLRAQSVMVIRLAEEEHPSRRHNLRGQALVTFTTQLAQLLGAGMPIFEGLSALEEQLRGEPAHRVVVTLCEQIKAGSSLSEALRRRPDSFNSLYCAMVAAGEASGSLDTTLTRLASLLARQLRLRKQVITALIYPSVIATFCTLVTFLLLTFAVPSIENLLEGRPLSPFTAAVLATSHFLSHRWLIYLPLLAATAYFLWRHARHLAWRLPLLKTLLIQSSLARFSRTLSTLQRGGLPMIDSLRLARGTVPHPALAAAIERAEARIVEGASLGAELQKNPLIPKLVGRMLRVGEESGNITPMLEQLADLYEGEVERTITRLTALAQPLILLVMGGIVGIIMLAVLLPLTDVSSFF
jgi:general secretion pathway protein F